MVPGMTERERLAADMQRLEWLADSVVGPSRLPRSPTRDANRAGGNRQIPRGLCRKSPMWAQALWRRIGGLQPRSVWPSPKSASCQPIPTEHPTI
jgi:hypothetical protein